jgi:DNA polymerase/3'-5' exonuclease PolX
VRALDYPIVDGKALKKAKNKVAGIGPKIADLIDKYLVTGDVYKTILF